MWSSTLDLMVALEAVLQQAAAKFTVLAGLATANILPIAYVCALFASIVEGTMRFGRWLYAAEVGAEEKLDEAYKKWARVLLDADAWKPWATIASELGWRLSGAGRAVVDVAMRRCRLFLLPEENQ